MSTATRGKKPIIPEEKLPPSFRRAKPVVLPQKGYNEYSESELVDQFTPMVIKWVHRLAYHPSLKQEMDDLRNIGLTALIKAKRNFKPELKVPFVAYCSTRIRGAILDAIRKRFAGSRTIGAKLRKVENAIYELSGNLDRPPTEEEIADHLRLSLDNYRELLDQVQKGVYISFNDQWASIETDEGIQEKPDEKQPDPSVEAGRHDLQEQVRERLAKMNVKQQKVISFYYFEGLRFKDIAEIMSITESRVCQIHTEAVLSLRGHIKRIEKQGI